MARASAPGLLLELLGGPDAAISRAPAPDEWQEMDRLAARHRLRPRLHALHRENPAVPGPIRDGWRAAHREWTLMALVQQADLADCVALLASEGFLPVALKGAWLARYTYPHPAERPMRDIDLLLPAEALIPAWHLLEGAGYVRDYAFDETLEHAMAIHRHLPALRSRRGTTFELHHQLWHPDDCAAGSDEGSGERMRRRAITRDGIAYPASDDLIEHLIIHAVYSHALDCGPLVLCDIALAANAEPPDGPAFWARARENGWAAGAALLITLSRRYHGASALPELAPDIAEPPLAVVDAGAALLLQDPDVRVRAEVAGQAVAHGPAALWRRFVRVRQDTGENPVSWAVHRIFRSAGHLLDPGFRAQVGNHAHLQAWLRG